MVWYFADHDDTIVLNIDYVINSVVEQEEVSIDII
jgi:hypothetical protein